jgi:hypothetical protein
VRDQRARIAAVACDEERAIGVATDDDRHVRLFEVRQVGVVVDAVSAADSRTTEPFLWRQRWEDARW